LVTGSYLTYPTTTLRCYARFATVCWLLVCLSFCRTVAAYWLWICSPDYTRFACHTPAHVRTAVRCSAAPVVGCLRLPVVRLRYAFACVHRTCRIRTYGCYSAAAWLRTLTRTRCLYVLLPFPGLITPCRRLFCGLRLYVRFYFTSLLLMITYHRLPVTHSACRLLLTTHSHYALFPVCSARFCLFYCYLPAFTRFTRTFTPHRVRFAHCVLRVTPFADAYVVTVATAFAVTLFAVGWISLLFAPATHVPCTRSTCSVRSDSGLIIVLPVVTAFRLFTLLFIPALPLPLRALDCLL